MKHAHVLFFLAFSTLLGGCVTEPAVRLWTAQVRNVGPPGVTMNMTMAVRNDNAFDLQLRNLNANVVLQDRYALPPVNASPHVWFPAGRTTPLSVPVTIPW